VLGGVVPENKPNEGSADLFYVVGFVV